MWYQAANRSPGRGESGQILILAALVQVVLIAVVGFGIDYGLLLVERTRLQNAADAASLAGARALVAGVGAGPSAATAAATTFLTLHGYANDADTTVTLTVLPTAAGRPDERMRIEVTRRRETAFIRVIGIEEATVAAVAEAEASRSMIDIFLTLDLTGSMELSGTNDLSQLRRAVVQFVGQFSLTTADPRSPRIGMARWAGIKCGWDRSADWMYGDRYIDLGPGTSEYVGPCSDDVTVLTNLTASAPTLVKLADNTGTGTCPPGMSIFACPLVSWRYTAPVVAGPSTTPLGLRYNGSNLGSYYPTYTGTKLPNAISVLNNGGYYGFATANGGRNDASGEGWARKVVVLMTDGYNELWPVYGNPAGDASPWDGEVVSRAAALKLGPDGTAGTVDDVEVYVVGFFCTPYSTSSSAPQKWCRSRMADTPAPHPCPGPWNQAQASAIDSLLRDVSSSSPGTCDRYFPLRKTEDLPQMFTVLAGQIARGRLTR